MLMVLAFLLPKLLIVFTLPLKTDLKGADDPMIYIENPVESGLPSHNVKLSYLKRHLQRLDTEKTVILSKTDKCNPCTEQKTDSITVDVDALSKITTNSNPNKEKPNKTTKILTSPSKATHPTTDAKLVYIANPVESNLPSHWVPIEVLRNSLTRPNIIYKTRSPCFGCQYIYDRNPKTTTTKKKTEYSDTKVYFSKLTTSTPTSTIPTEDISLIVEETTEFPLTESHISSNESHESTSVSPSKENQNSPIEETISSTQTSKVTDGKPNTKTTKKPHKKRKTKNSDAGGVDQG